MATQSNIVRLAELPRPACVVAAAARIMDAPETTDADYTAAMHRLETERATSIAGTYAQARLVLDMLNAVSEGDELTPDGLLAARHTLAQACLALHGFAARAA